MILQIYYYITKDGKGFGSFNRVKIEAMSKRANCKMEQCELWQFYYNANNELLSDEWNG